MIGFNRTHGYINCSKGKVNKVKNEIKGYGFFFKNKWVLIHVQKNKKAPETLDTNGNVKTTPNLYLQPLDTMEDTNIDTTKLDFSLTNFFKIDLKKKRHCNQCN